MVAVDPARAGRSAAAQTAERAAAASTPKPARQAEHSARRTTGTDGASSFAPAKASPEAQRLRERDARFGNDLTGFPADLSALTREKGSKFLIDTEGRRYALTPGRAPGHAAEQLRADRLYRILGVHVPASRGYPDAQHPGSVVKLSRVLDDSESLEATFADAALAPLLKKRAESELAAHALLEHWNVFSENDLRVRVDRSRPGDVRVLTSVVRTPGALRYRVRGELKPTTLDAYPMALWTLRDGTNRAATRAFGGVRWNAIIRQMDRLLERRDQLLAAVAEDPALQRVLSARLDTMDYLQKATRKLSKAGLSEEDIEERLRDMLSAERAGGKRVAIKDLAPEKAKGAAKTQLARLNATQLHALELVRTSAARNAAAALPALTSQLISSHGCTPAGAKRVLDYIRDHANVEIYFNPQKQLSSGENVLGSFVRTGTYQNQFETKISGGSLGAYAGSGRDGWERTIFQGAYHGGALIPSERPKYGAINAEGLTVPTATHYGTAFLVLKPEVKARVTFTPRDSSAATAAQVGTVDHVAHTLSQVPGGISQIVDYIMGRPPSGTRSHYLEAQIHGPIEFDKDVARIVGHTSQRATYGNQFREFSRRFNVPLFWNDGRQIVADR